MSYRRSSVPTRSRALVLVAIAGLLATTVTVVPTPLAPVARAVSGTWWVATSGTADPGNGTGCGNPDFVGTDHNVINDAIGTVPGGETIVFCNGTYTVGNNVVVDKGGLIIQGETTTGTIIAGNGSYQLFDASGQDITFRGITLTNGRATYDGGAVYGRNVTAIGARFIGNSATEYGGAIAADDSVVSQWSVYEDNTADTKSGGAISANTGTVSSLHDQFTRNIANDQGGAIFAFNLGVDSTAGVYVENGAGSINGYGGAIAAAGGLVRSRSDHFTGNHAPDGGGAIYALDLDSSSSTYEYNVGAYGGAVTLDASVRSLNDVFRGNDASGDGGAINAASVDSTGGTYEDNTSGSYGGAIATYAPGDVTSDGDAFRRNSSLDVGGAIYVLEGDLTSANGTYEDNTSQTSGGALYADLGNITTRFDRFLRNHAEQQGGAVYADGDVDSSSGIYEDNSANDSAAAVYATNMTSLYDGYRRNWAYGDGGAIIVDAIDVTGGTFEDNTASTGWGGAILSYGVTTIDRSTLARNTGTAYGGAVATNSASAVVFVLNSTFVGNLVTNDGSGGAISGYTDVYATYTTFVDNTADTHTYGDTISTDDDLYFDHVLIVGSGTGATDCKAANLYDAGFSIETGYSCLTDDGTSTGNLLSADSTAGTDRADLHLGTFGANNGTTWTVALDPGSLAIDFDTTCAAGIDQRGVTRPAGDGCDTGAYEAEPPAVGYIVRTQPASDPCLQYGSIQAAVDAALPNDVIHLCDGIRRLSSTVTVTKENLTFEGDSTAGTVIDGEDAVQLFDATAVSSVTFRGLTLTNGRAELTSGGAVVGNSIAIVGVDVTSNTASGTDPDSGGGAVKANGPLTITGSRFADNAADGSGGSVWVTGPATIRSSTFSRNETNRAGGAVWADGPLSVTDGTAFADNTAYTFGGAIWVHGPATIRGGAAFSGNVATSDAGGAIYADGPVDSRAATYEENVAQSGGGAIYATVSITSRSDTFEGNSALGDGGALYSLGAVSTSDGTYTGNASGRGGAIFADVSVALLGGDELTGNTSGSWGGAISSPVVRGVGARFAENSALQYGGAIGFEDDTRAITVELTASTFLQNAAFTGGAGIALSSHQDIRVALDRVDMTAHGVMGNGGAIAISENDSSATSRLTIRNGSFTGNSGGRGDGGAIWAAGSGGGVTSVAIVGTHFEGNSISGNGGAVFASGSLELSGATFVDNTGGTAGGAVHASGDVTVTDGTFTANSADFGGAIGTDSPETSVVVARATFAGNYAAQSGGAILAAGSFESSGATYRDNTTVNLNGGAIYHGAPTNGSPLVSRDDSFTGNVAAGYAGAIYSEMGVAILRSTFFGNRGAGYGGAIGTNGSVEATNATFVANFVASDSGTSYGGAIWAAGNLTATYSTFVDNSTDSGASTPAGDAILLDLGMTATFDHVLIVGSGPAGDCDLPDATINDVGGSVETGTTCLGAAPTGPDSTSGTAREDVKLGSFADHGGLTWTYSLTDGSVAIDVDATVSCSVATDQRGVARPIGAGCDAGAYEAPAGQVAVTPLYNGPWWVNSSTTLANLSLAATVSPATAGCLVRFDVSGTLWTTSGSTGDTTSFTTSGTSRSDGSVSAPLTNVRLGMYVVTVTVTGGGCTASGTDTGMFSVLPGTVSKGSVGSGAYRLVDTGGWRKTNSGHIVSVSSSYNRKTGLTTTTTRGQLLWYSTADNSAGASGWRLKATINSITTGGGSPWQPFACPTSPSPWTSPSSPNPICGRFSGTGLLQQRDTSGAWVAAPYGAGGVVSFTVTVYDGGTLTSCVRKACKTTDLADLYGLTIVGVPIPTSASDALPQLGAPVRLRNGSLRNF